MTHRRDAEKMDIRTVDGEQNGEGVVVAGIDVEPDVFVHRALATPPWTTRSMR